MSGEAHLVRHCPFCRAVSSVTVPLAAWFEFRNPSRERGIQEIFPQLTDSQRELILTGICDPCWTKTFAEQDQVDNSPWEDFDAQTQPGQPE